MAGQLPGTAFTADTVEVNDVVCGSRTPGDSVRVEFQLGAAGG